MGQRADLATPGQVFEQKSPITLLEVRDEITHVVASQRLRTTVLG